MAGQGSNDILSLELAAILQEDYQDEREFLDSILVNPQQPSYDHIPQNTQSLPPDPTTEAEVAGRLNTNEVDEPLPENQNLPEVLVPDPSNPTEDELIPASISMESLSWDMVSQHFYKPGFQAASDLGIGETKLKKRCRELGFERWPYRKLQSVLTTIQNVRDLGQTSDGEIDARSREKITYLEDWLRRIEENPDLPLDPELQRFRQSCFKAIYLKKRKLEASTSSNTPAPVFDQGESLPEIVILSDSESDEDKNDVGVRGLRHISDFYP